MTRRLVRWAWYSLGLLLACGSSHETPQAEPALPRARGQVMASIAISPPEPGPNQKFVITYRLTNNTADRLRVVRIETNLGVIGPTSPNWRSGDVGPGQNLVIATQNGQTGPGGSENLTATFVTDRGSFDAQPVRIAIKTQPQGLGSGPVRARISVLPNPAQPGQNVTVNYELFDSSDRDINVTSIITDSGVILPDNPIWLQGRVAARTSGTIARMTTSRALPGQYVLRAQFDSDQGRFTAEPVVLIVAAPELERDTGHVLARIAITPNPCPINADYRIDYELINTTRRSVAVSLINSDIGPLGPGRAEWLTGEARAGATTTIVRITGTGSVISSRVKTATFVTSEGPLTAPPVTFVVQSE